MSDLVPDGWTKPRLKEVVTHFQNGYAFSAKGYIEQGIPIISMGSIQLDGQFKKVNSKLKFWDVNKKKELSRYLVKPNDLIMAMTDVTPTMELIGRSCIVKGKPEYFLNQRVGLISFKEAEISKEYFSYYTNFNEWRSYCIGSSGLGAQANLGTSQILDGLVSLPPLPEQQKIARILTSVDDVIEKTQAQIDKLKDLKTGMMQELLTNGIGNNGKPHTKFKDSPVGKIPAEWSIIKISELCTHVVDCVNKTAPVVDFKTPYKMIRTTNVRHGRVDTENVRNVTKETFEIWTRRLLPENSDLIFTREAPVGECGILKDSRGVFLGQRTMMYRANKTKTYSEFLMYSIMSDYGKQQLDDFSGGSTVGHMRVPDCGKILIKTPPLDEQNNLVNSLKNVDIYILEKEKKLEKVTDTKKALMQDLLTGKVRVKIEQTA